MKKRTIVPNDAKSQQGQSRGGKTVTAKKLEHLEYAREISKKYSGRIAYSGPEITLPMEKQRNGLWNYYSTSEAELGPLTIEACQKASQYIKDNNIEGKQFALRPRDDAKGKAVFRVWRAIDIAWKKNPFYLWKHRGVWHFSKKYPVSE
jgi:hypothetical protein